MGRPAGLRVRVPVVRPDDFSKAVKSARVLSLIVTRLCGSFVIYKLFRVVIY